VKSATYFSTGVIAYSSDNIAWVYFKCRMKAPAHEIVIEAQLGGPEGQGNKPPQKDIRVHRITAANAAARKVAADLGCQNTGLVQGVPKPAP
jgi:hypothetical protein